MGIVIFTTRINGFSFGVSTSKINKMTIHPAIKIMTFLVFSIALAVSPFSNWLLAIILVVCCWLGIENLPTRKSLNLVKRLKWLYISLFVVYVFFTPGEFVLPWAFGPTYAGLEAAFIRILVIILIVLAVDILLASMVHQELVSGLYVLFLPFAYFGFNPQKFTVRVYLVLEKVSDEQSLKFFREKMGTDLNEKQKISYFVDCLTSRFMDIMRQTSPITTLEIDEFALPKWFEWLLPIFLGLVFLVFNLYA